MVTALLLGCSSAQAPQDESVGADALVRASAAADELSMLLRNPDVLADRTGEELGSVPTSAGTFHLYPVRVSDEPPALDDAPVDAILVAGERSVFLVDTVAGHAAGALTAGNDVRARLTGEVRALTQGEPTLGIHTLRPLSELTLAANALKTALNAARTALTRLTEAAVVAEREVTPILRTAGGAARSGQICAGRCQVVGGPTFIGKKLQLQPDPVLLGKLTKQVRGNVYIGQKGQEFMEFLPGRRVVVLTRDEDLYANPALLERAVRLGGHPDVVVSGTDVGGKISSLATKLKGKFVVARSIWSPTTDLPNGADAAIVVGQHRLDALVHAAKDHVVVSGKDFTEVTTNALAAHVQLRAGRKLTVINEGVAREVIEQRLREINVRNSSLAAPLDFTHVTYLE